MGALSIWHWLLILAVLAIFGLPSLLLLVIKPKGRNRFGARPAPMNMGQSVTACMKNYAVFKGRASRSEYWWFYLVYILILVGASCLEDVLHVEISRYISYAFVLPILGAGVRRLHDINRSGWWILLSFGLGLFVLLYLWAQPSQKDDVETAQVFE